MSNQTHFIAQIQEEEKKAEKMLADVEVENNQRINKESETADNCVLEAENVAFSFARIKMAEAKENAKDKYKRMIVDSDNERRDIVGRGKVNISKGKKHIMEVFMEVFS